MKVFFFQNKYPMAPSYRNDMLARKEDYVNSFDFLKESKAKVPDTYISVSKAKQDFGLTYQVFYVSKL